MAWRYRYPRDQMGVCRVCGEESTLQRRPGRAERVGYFLSHGIPAPEEWLCPNGHRTEGRTGAVTMGRKTRLRRLRRWFRYGRAVHDARTAEPVPMTYLGALGIGLVLGAILDAWLGWPWWLVAVGALVLVWLIFMASALRRDARKDMLRNLRQLADPVRAHKRDLAEIAAAVESGEVAAYGIVDWPGSVAVGGWGASNGSIRSVTLRHHTTSREGYVEVAMRRSNRYNRDRLKHELRQDILVNSSDLPPRQEPSDIGRRMLQRRWQAMQQPLPEWSELTIDVEGDPVVFDFMEREGEAVAVAELDDGSGYLVAEAHRARLEGLALVQLREIARYVEGSMMMIAKRHRPG